MIDVPGPSPLRNSTTRQNGLSSDFVRVIFQDREANIWVGTQRRPGPLQPQQCRAVVSLPQCHAIGYAHAAGDSGTLWSSCPRTDSTMGFVTEFVTGGRRAARHGIFTAGYRDPDGGVWFAGPSGLGAPREGRFVAIPLPEQARGLDVQAVRS